METWKRFVLGQQDVFDQDRAAADHAELRANFCFQAKFNAGVKSEDTWQVGRCGQCVDCISVLCEFRCLGRWTIGEGATISSNREEEAATHCGSSSLSSWESLESASAMTKYSDWWDSRCEVWICKPRIGSFENALLQQYPTFVANATVWDQVVQKLLQGAWASVALVQCNDIGKLLPYLSADDSLLRSRGSSLGWIGLGWASEAAPTAPRYLFFLPCLAAGTSPSELLDARSAPSKKPPSHLPLSPYLSLPFPHFRPPFPFLLSTASTRHLSTILFPFKLIPGFRRLFSGISLLYIALLIYWIHCTKTTRNKSIQKRVAFILATQPLSTLSTSAPGGNFMACGSFMACGTSAEASSIWETLSMQATWATRCPCSAKRWNGESAIRWLSKISKSCAPKHSL